MCVHNARRELAQLAHVAHQQYFGKIQHSGLIQRFAHIVAALDHRHTQSVPALLGQKIRAVVAGGQNQARALRPGLPQLKLHAFDQRGLAHGLYNAAGAQNRKPAHNAQLRVEGFFRQRLAAGRGNDDLQPAGVSKGCADLPGAFLDHTARGGIDGPFPHRLVQPGLGHPANALAPAHGKARRGFLGAGINKKAVGDVGIIAGILLHRAFGPARPGPHSRRLHLHLPAPGRGQGKRGRGLPAQQKLHGPCRRQRCAGACGVAAPQLLLPAADIPFKRHALCPLFFCARALFVHSCLALRPAAGPYIITSNIITAYALYRKP